MGIRNFPVITIGTDTATTVGGIAAAGNVAIPNTQGGSGPKYLHIKAFDNTAAPAIDTFISVTPDIAANNGAFATGFILSAYYFDEIILNVHGCTHIGYDKIGTNSPDLQLTPLEDY